MNFKNIDKIFKLSNIEGINIKSKYKNKTSKYFFCKCGHQALDNHNICPICGLNKTIEISNIKEYTTSHYDLKDVYDFVYKISSTQLIYRDISVYFIKGQFECTCANERIILDLTKNKINIWDVYTLVGSSTAFDYSFIIPYFSKNMDSIDFNDFKTNPSSFYNKEFEEMNYFNILKENYECNNEFLAYISYMFIKSFYKDYKKIDLNFLLILSRQTPFKDKQFYNLSYNEILKFYGLEFLKNIIVDKNIFKGVDYFYLNSYKDFTDKYKNTSKFKDYLDYFVKDILYAIEHYDLNFQDVYVLSRDFFDLDIEYDDLFKYFIHSNLVLFKQDTIKEFIKKIKYLSENGIKITKENLKTIDINICKDKLKNILIPEENKTLFLDLFDSDPIESMNLLYSSKKLSKNKKNEIIKKLL